MTKTRSKLTVTALMLGIAGVATTIAPAQAASMSSTAQLKAWDTDHDGTLDLAEAKKAAEAKFDRLDTDHDGTLDAKEIASTQVHKMSFSKADTDQDGTLDKSEYLALVETRFKAADTDNDSTVSDAELSTKAGMALARLL
jgi:5-hydroxyisourate hydrolase-like protein (transthyretin family)